MTTGVACPVPILQFFNNAGQPAIGGSVLTQVGGVNAATYSDINLTQPLPNPIPLNSRGEVSTAAGASSQLFLPANTAYVFTVFDANGNQLNQSQYVNGVALNTQAGIGQILYPKNAFETTAAVTPVAFQYEDLPEFLGERYGLVGDGATNNDVAIANVIAVATAAGGGILKLPPGVFYFNTQITFPTNFVIQGAGSAATFLRANNANNGILIASTSGRCGLKDLSLYSNTVGTGIGITIGDSNGQSSLNVFENVIIVNWATGTKNAASAWNQFVNVEWSTNTVGFDFNATGSNFTSACSFWRCIVTGNTNAGIKASAVPVNNQNISFYHCTIQQNCALSTSTPELSLTDGTSGCYDVIVDGCYFEAHSSAITAINIQQWGPFRISGCFFSGSTYNYCIRDVGGGTASQGLIFSNSFGNPATAAISATSETDVWAFNNLTTGTVTLTGTGSRYLPTGSGIGSWPTDEVSFSPVVHFASSGSIGGLTTVGTYSQVGHVLTFTLRIDWTSASSPSGNVSITGLPVAAKSSAGDYAFAMYYTGITVSAGSLQAVLLNNTTTLLLYNVQTTTAQLTGSALGSTGTIIVSGSYQV